MKAFLNIGFVLLCLGMLWYLFTFNPNNSTDSQIRTENRDTYVEDDYDFDDEDVESGRSGRVINEAPIDYEEVDDYPSRRKSGGIFGRSDTEEPTSRRRPQENYDYDAPYASENPYDRKDTYQEPVTSSRRSNSQYAEPEKNTNTYGLRFGSKRFSRDSRLGTYKGPMLNGQPHGFGVFEYDNKDLYIGEYRNGQRNGWGNSIYRRSNKVQLRQYSKGKKIDSNNVPTVTYGTMRYVHGGSKGTYYGPMKNREPHGFGYFRYDDNSMYIGSYKNGKRDGSGCMVYPDKSINNVKYDMGRKIGS